MAISGNIGDGGAGLPLSLADAGTLVLSGSNAYTGGTYVRQGSLIAGNTDSIPDGTPLLVGAGGTFLFDPTAAASSTSEPSASRAAAPAGAVPEPSTLALLAAAWIVAATAAWRRKRS